MFSHRRLWGPEWFFWVTGNGLLKLTFGGHSYRGNSASQ
jgi:hypothetical protein